MCIWIKLLLFNTINIIMILIIIYSHILIGLPHPAGSILHRVSTDIPRPYNPANAVVSLQNPNVGDSEFFKTGSGANPGHTRTNYDYIVAVI